MAASLVTFVAPHAQAQMTGISGAYLAGSSALRAHEYETAARYFDRALAFDGGNVSLLQSAVLANVSAGALKRAVPSAQSLVDLRQEGQLAGLVLIANLIGESDFHAALGALRDDTYALSPLIKDLLIGWMHAALGENAAALAQFGSMGTDGDAVAMFGSYHAALLHAVNRDFDKAEAILAQGAQGTIRLSSSSIAVHAQILAELGEAERALAVMNAELATGRSNPELQTMRDKLVLGEPVEFTALSSPTEGAANVFETFAGIVLGGKERAFALQYARLALHLQPDNIRSILIAAELLEEQEQYDLAIRELERVPAEAPSYLRAEIARARALESAGQLEVAIEVLRQLERSHGESSSVHTALGLMFRTSKQFSDCVTSYSRAIDLIETPQRRDWYVYYSRAICNERGDAWDAAEADFRTALERAPEQPLVLNYLGYSMVEKGLGIDEAKGMIERAVAARPDSGFVTDSLGWVLYRLGEFEAAVPHMERAVELEPLDPIINDHLGDVLWMVGRTREARFQWRRALSFGPEPNEAERIRRKLDIGLDAVLADEASADAETISADGG